MKRIVVICCSILFSISVSSQNIKYQKDERSQNVKENMFNNYQNSEINILKALEIAGIKIFDITISPVFEKEYNLSVNLDEYIDGKKVNSRDIIYTHQGKNVYVYHVKGSIEQESIPYFDYIPKLTFFSKDNDTTLLLSIDHYGGSTTTSLKKSRLRDRQIYSWRTYSKIDWKLNEDVPLLVYASSWYDERSKVERFCGVSDLSEDEEKTKELLDNSQHYYVISLKVFE